MSTMIQPKSIASCLAPCGQTNGVVVDMPRADYDAIHRLNPSSIASGLLDHEEVDPASIKYEFETQKKFAQASQDRMDRGTVAHMLLLQPDRVSSEVAIWKGGRRYGSEWDGFQAENSNKIILTFSDWNDVNDAVRAFRFQPKLNELLTDLSPEVAMFSKERSVYTKGMVDAITNGDLCRIIDLKTTDAGISYQSVRTTIRNFHYREKMAAYKRWYERETGREVIGCYNVFLSMTKPYSMRIVKMSTIALEWGEMRIMTALDAVENCLQSGKWPMFCGDDVADVQQYELPIEGEEVQLDFGND